RGYPRRVKAAHDARLLLSAERVGRVVQPERLADQLAEKRLVGTAGGQLEDVAEQAHADDRVLPATAPRPGRLGDAKLLVEILLAVAEVAGGEVLDDHPGED